MTVAAVVFLLLYKKNGNTEHDHANKEHCATLQAIHTGIDNIRLDKFSDISEFSLRTPKKLYTFPHDSEE